MAVKDFTTIDSELDVPLLISANSVSSSSMLNVSGRERVDKEMHELLS